MRYVPWLEPLVAACSTSCVSRVTAIVLIVALFIAHKWLPSGQPAAGAISAGHRSRRWCCGSWRAIVFGRYLADFAYTYVTYYAGLASAMIALVFLYLIASIFIYGGELNTVIEDAAREARAPQ